VAPTPPRGRLEIRGVLEPDTLWPAGGADADTLRITLAAPEQAIRFYPAGRRRGEPTDLPRAWVHGRVTRPVVDRAGRVTVRLEGIDAPELHYRPPGAGGAPRLRQPFAESAARALHDLLRPLGARLRCLVVADVGAPEDALDVYGRIVGELRVQAPRGALDLAPWLVARGWAVPAFYASTPPARLARLATLARRARGRRLGLWAVGLRAATRSVGPLRYRSGALADDAPDRGPVLLPKLFRRLAAWQYGDAEQGSFRAALHASREGYWSCADFLALGRAAPLRPLVSLLGPGGVVDVDPTALVFPVAPRRLRP
jgi:endonuclease YncB( thermonuclease family)